ncbi:MAG: DUF4157 domain-containing protein [bacterium]|nr:DUF4157 domain-containing protein [bacterium]
MRPEKRRKPNLSNNTTSKDMFIRPSAVQVAQMSRENLGTEAKNSDFNNEGKLNRFGEAAFIQPNSTAQSRLESEHSGNMYGHGNDTELPKDLKAGVENLSGYSMDDVKVHRNSSKPSELEAHAYAQGSDIYLGPGQERHLAHEAWHVVQQKQGRVDPTGIENNTAVNDNKGLESEADKMGSLAAQSNSSSSESKKSAESGQVAQGNTVQKYTKRVGKVGRKNGFNRLSDDGKLAVKDHGKKGFAEDSMISQANTILDGMNSIAKVEKLTNEVEVPVPKTKDQTNKLTEFTLVDRVSGNELCLTDDCGRANQEIMGSKHHNSEELVALYGAGKSKETTSTTYHGDDRKAGGNLSTTEELSGQIYIDIIKTEFGEDLNRIEALEYWSKLSWKKKEELSKKYEINDFAVPEMGQGITIGSERDMPLAQGGGYNFHFGFSLMKSGHDYITLEDYASSGRTYYLDMYGPESKNQAWAQDYGNTSAMDSKTTTMVVKHPDN